MKRKRTSATSHLVKGEDVVQAEQVQEDIENDVPHQEFKKHFAFTTKEELKEAVTPSHVNDPSIYYRCCVDLSGKKARVCIATPSCAAHPTYFLHRDALEKHLRQSHNISCHVPGIYNIK